MRSPMLCCIAVLVAGCQVQNDFADCIISYNVEITAPVDGLISPSETWWVEALYNGPETEDVSEQLSLVIDGTQPLPVDEAVIEDSVIRIPVEPGAVGPGEHQLVLSIGERANVCEFARDEITIAVAPTVPPQITLLPEEFPDYCGGFNVDVLVEDPDEDDLGVLVISINDLNGMMAGAALPTSAPSGQTTFFVQRAPAGAYVLDATVTDPAGAVGGDQLTTVFPVADCDGDDYVWALDDPANADTLDCDDDNQAVHPGALEVCNGIDDDCDGLVDEDDADDATTWYVDNDGDGFGDDSTGAASCTPLPGGVDVGGDCDDDEAAVNPAATEVCNGIDDDCDGTIDLNPDPSDPNAVLFYADVDGDTFGDPDAPTYACVSSPPPGFADDPFDCDDTDEDVNPIATEICGNGIDDDCDGGADEDCVIDECEGRTEILLPEVWDSTVTHHVPCIFQVHTTLTIEDGAKVTFGPLGAIHVGEDQFGTLLVQGSTNRVRFEPDEPGNAGRLRFFDDDLGSVLEGFDFTEGLAASVWVEGGDVTLRDCSVSLATGDGVRVGDYAGAVIEDCDITLNTGHGVHVDDQGALGDGSPGTFHGNLVADNLDHPLSLPPDAGGAIAVDNVFTGNFRETVELRNGDLTRDATWEKIGTDWEFSQIWVRNIADPELQIAPGATFRVRSGGTLNVGNVTPGRLVIDAVADPVVFTSAAPVANRGDWNGLRFYDFDSGSSVDGVELAYATHAVQAYRTVDVALAHLDVHDVSQTGVYLQYTGTHVTVTDSTLSGGLGNGIDGTQNNPLGVTLSGTTITGFGGYPVFVSAAGAHLIDGTNTLTGNADDRVNLFGGVAQSATWVDVGVPYRVGGMAIGGPAGPILTLEDGVELQNTGAIVVSNSGALRVNGGALGVLFTSAEAVPAPGDWTGLTFTSGTNNAASIVEGLTIEYAGEVGSAVNLVSDGAPTLHDVVVRNSDRNGIQVASNGNPVFENVTVDGCGGVGITYGSTVMGPSFGTTVTGCTGVPAAVRVNVLGTFDNTGTYTGNGWDVIDVDSSSDVNAHLSIGDPGVPLYLGGDLTFNTCCEIPDIDVAAGVEFQMGPGANWIVVKGYLSLLGTPADPVVITSAEASPAAGDWGRLIFGARNDATVLENVVVEYGGAGSTTGGMVDVSRNNMSITDCTVRHSSDWGIYRVGGVAPSISNITYTGNASGDLF